MVDNRLNKDKFRGDAMIKGEKKGERTREKTGQRSGESTGKKSGERTWLKAGDQTGKKFGEKTWQKAGEKAGQKYGEKAWQRADEKTERKSGEKAWSKSGEHTGKKFGEKTWQKAGEKTGQKYGEKTWQRADEKTERKSGEKTWSKAGEQTGKKYGEKTWQKAGEKTGQKYGEKTWQGADDKTGRKSGEKTWSKAGEQTGKKYGEKTWQKAGEKTGQKYGEKTWQGADDKTGRKSGEKTWSKAGEQTGKKFGEKTWQKAGEKTGQKYGEKTWQGADDKAGRKSGEKTWSKAGEQTGKRFGEKAWQGSDEKTGRKSVGKTWQKDGEKTGRKPGERTWQKDGEKTGYAAGKRSGQDSRDIKGKKNGKFGSDGIVSPSNRDKKVEEKVFSKGGKKNQTQCPVFRICGGCQLLDIPYKQQLEQKEKRLEELLKPYCRLEAMIGMENPYHYRNKVHAVFDRDKKGNPFSGVYEANSHRVVPVETCLIEDQKADEIIGTIRGMLKSFKIRTYDEDTGYGLLRHVLIRRGFATGEIMAVLVTASPIFPSKNNFVKALLDKHPEITTVIQNINGRGTNMVLGDKEHVLYGKGFIEDILCGYRFRISSKSFYQVNPVQTEILYKKAIEAAGLTGKERVIDAYCGIGTIGIVASQYAKEVIGVELNRDAVRDAVENAKINGLDNVKFFCNDAGKFMENMAENGEHADVVFLDPPRSGSTVEFIDSVAKLKPKKVIYVSCGPETLARDLELFRKKGYEAKKGWGVDLFPITGHVEAVIMMTYCGKEKK
jgi:23S rRNA (uracil1939-C5)-methyltransferase